MSYGSAPVIVNKLRYQATNANGKAEEAWNLRPRDMFNLARWISTDSERRVNWQVVDLTGRASEQLFDAPILLIGGNKPPKFSEQEIAVLKNYINRGGLIVGNADCGSEEFSKGFTDLGHVLEPDYEFRVLPDEHPICARQIYPASKFKKKIRIRGLSNGVRELMLIADPDLSKSLNLNDINSARETFQTWSNIIQYATDKSGLRQKGITQVSKLDPKIATVKKIQIARIQYAGNWNPEPGGWDEFGAEMHNQRKFDVETQTTELGKGDLQKHKIAHLTGTGNPTLSDAQRAELKSFIDGGGTLIIDAAGGDSAFAIWVEAELEKIFGSTATDQLREVAPVTNRIYGSMGQPNVAVKYRRFAKDKVPQDRHEPNLRVIEKDGRPAVIYSREDIGAGLVGQHVDGIYGYEPESAAALMRSILESIH